MQNGKKKKKSCLLKSYLWEISKMEIIQNAHLLSKYVW